jgi:hypothetical protein
MSPTKPSIWKQHYNDPGFDAARCARRLEHNLPDI